MSSQQQHRQSSGQFGGLTQAEVARIANVTVRTVRRWEHDSNQPQARHAQRLDDLRTVLDELSKNYTPTGCLVWLRNRNRLLNARRPLDMLAAGEFDKVYGAAMAFTEGVFV